MVASVPSPESLNVRNVPLIAIVDDSANMREALFGLIGSLGYQAEVFESAEAFLESTGDRTFDCLILDVAMPGLSGIQLQARLNEQGSTLPIIFVTSRNDDATRDAALKAGATCFLGKPVEDTELISCLNLALQT